MSFLQFFQTYEKVFTAVGAVATVGALVFAGYQIRDAGKSVEAATVYNLQKDGRELNATLAREHPEAWRAILTPGQADKVDPAELQLVAVQLVQYFSAVVNQHRNGVIGDAFWMAFDQEMCGLVRRPVLASFWKANVVAGSYSDEFKEWGAQCLAPMPRGARP